MALIESNLPSDTYASTFPKRRSVVEDTTGGNLLTPQGTPANGNTGITGGLPPLVPQTQTAPSPAQTSPAPSAPAPTSPTFDWQAWLRQIMTPQTNPTAPPPPTFYGDTRPSVIPPNVPAVQAPPGTVPPGTTPPATAPQGDYRKQMLGFDFARIPTAQNSAKYAAANLLQHLDPSDPNNLTKVYEQLRARGYQVSYDPTNHNLMLNDENGSGYIGWRPLDRKNPKSKSAWQWLWYNPDVPGPHGEGRLPTTTPAPTTPTTPTTPTASLLPFNPYQMYPYYGAPQPAQTPAPTTPSALTNPSFWQSLMGALTTPAGNVGPSFTGAQTGLGSTAPTQNPQIMQMLSQLLASLGGR